MAIAMRLAVISDIHGNVVALDAVLRDLKQRSPDLVVNLGDLVTSPLWPRETLELLDTLNVATVRGNHDRWLAERPVADMPASMRFAHDALTAPQRASLGALPATIRLDDGILAVHGTPASDTEYLLEELVDGRLALATTGRVAERLGGHEASLVLCGHSHHQHIASRGDVVVVNPGSVGMPRYADNDDPFLAEAGSPHARYAVVTRRNRRWSAELILLDYDWAPVLHRAREHDRRDFAAGFIRS